MSELHTLIFGENHLGPTLRGTKQITLRKYRPHAHEFKKGEIVCGEFGERFSMLLKISADTELKTFAELTDTEAREDGFASAVDAFESLKNGYYPDLTPEDTLAIIRYEVLRVNGAHIVAS